MGENGLLAGKRLVITGVITEKSIAFTAARIAQEQGATVVLTGYGRMSLVNLVARKLPVPAPVLELDVTDKSHMDTLAERVGEHLDGVDGVVHSIAFAPASCLGGFMDAPWEDVATTLHVSTYSYRALASALLPLMAPGGSIVGLTFDGTRAWPAYDWMGVAKSGLESANRYLARYLGPRGIRANLVAAGPLRTMAARQIPGLVGLDEKWDELAPLGWEPADPAPAARACLALLTEWFGATTGQVVHVDGGYHAVGA